MPLVIGGQHERSSNDSVIEDSTAYIDEYVMEESVAASQKILPQQVISRDSHAKFLYFIIILVVGLIVILWPSDTHTVTLTPHTHAKDNPPLNPYRNTALRKLENFSPCNIPVRSFEKIGLKHLTYNRKINDYLIAKLKQNRDSDFPQWTRVAGPGYKLRDIQECLYSTRGSEERYAVGISFEKFWWQNNNAPIDGLRTFFHSYMKNVLRSDDILEYGNIDGLTIAILGTYNSSTCEALIEGDVLIHLDQTHSKACTVLRSVAAQIILN